MKPETIIIIGIAVLLLALVVLWLWKMPKAERIKKFKAWLLLAVIEAEKYFEDSKMGQLKLQMVYEWAVEKFPWVEWFLSEEQFKLYVDEALEEMRRLLEENKSVQKYIETDNVVTEVKL